MIKPINPFINVMINDRYFIRDLIHTSYHNWVYKAWDRLRSTFVCVKILMPEFSDNEDNLVLIRNEGNFKDILHPNIIRIFDFGEFMNTGFSVSEWINGLPLPKYIKNKKFSPILNIGFLIEVCSGLEYLHKQGFVHCDLKPENIIIRNSGEACLLDLELCKKVGEIRPTGGTPRYMAPEQLENLPVNFQTDIFAIGWVLYYCLLGKQPDLSNEEKVQAVLFFQKQLGPYYDIINNANRQNQEKNYTSITEFVFDIYIASNYKKNLPFSFLRRLSNGFTKG